jgi:hypothetical protein
MQLTYRGSRYTVNAQSLETEVTEQEATFLGNRYKLKGISPRPLHQPTEYLRYRGGLYLA